jgi:hypothetical protein
VWGEPSVEGGADPFVQDLRGGTGVGEVAAGDSVTQDGGGVVAGNLGGT